MKILDITEVKLESVDLRTLTQHPWKPYEQPEGYVGVTTILRYIAVSLGTLKLHEEDTEDRPWRMLMGMGWEAMGAQLYPDMVWQPRALKKAWVVGHPDGRSVLIDPYPYIAEIPCIEEFKYTARSLREKGAKKDQYKDIRSEWMWMQQMRSYIAMSRTMMDGNQPLLGRFHVMWAMGVYDKFTLDERYLRYVVEYERAEIESTWALLDKNKEKARDWAYGH